MVSKVSETDAALDGEEPIEFESTDDPALEEEQEPEISNETLDDVRRKARISMPHADLDDPQADPEQVARAILLRRLEAAPRTRAQLARTLDEHGGSRQNQHHDEPFLEIHIT